MVEILIPGNQARQQPRALELSPSQMTMREGAINEGRHELAWSASDEAHASPPRLGYHNN